MTDGLDDVGCFLGMLRKHLELVTSIPPEFVVLAKKDSCDINPRHFLRGHRPPAGIGEAMKPFLAHISDILNRWQTCLSVTAQRSAEARRYRQDILIISAAVLVVLVLFFIGAYVITRF